MSFSETLVSTYESTRRHDPEEHRRLTAVRSSNLTLQRSDRTAQDQELFSLYFCKYLFYRKMFQCKSVGLKLNV
jgi:hypothetical protein